MSLQNNRSDQNKPPVFLTVLGVVSFLFIAGLILYLAEYLQELSEAAGGTGRGYAIEVVEGQTIYVPVYSHIYSGGGEAHLLEVTLSVRNTDPERTIRLVAVQYFDTRGVLVKNYLEQSVGLGPMETVEFLVEKLHEEI